MNLNKDFILVRTEMTPSVTYEMYQEINNPFLLLLVRITTTTVTGSTSSVKEFSLQRVNLASEATTAWGNRAGQTYQNLINIFI